MAKYRITAPNGERFDITAPDDATQDDVFAYAQQNFAGQMDKSIPVAGYSQNAPVAQKSSSIMDRLRGAGEAALSAATGTLATTAAVPYGIYKQVESGKYGKPEGTRLAEKKALEFAQKYTYEPKTEKGQEYIENVAKVAEPLQAIAPLSEVAALSRISPVKNAPLLTEGQSDALTSIVQGTKKPFEKAVAIPRDIGRAIKAGLYDPLANKEKIIGSTLAQAVGEENIPSIVSNLQREAKTPGVVFSAGQRTGNEALAAIEDAIKATAPSGELSFQAAKNRQALANQLRSIAQDELSMEAAKSARTAATEPLYKSLESASVIGGDDLSKLLQRARASGALQEAQKIADVRGTKFEIPVVEAPRYGEMTQADLPSLIETTSQMPERVKVEKTPNTLMGHLKSNGGINKEYMPDILGERSTNKSGAIVGLFKNQGRSIDDAVMSAVEGNYLPASVLDEVDGGVGKLAEMLDDEVRGIKHYPMDFDQYAQQETAKYNATPQEVSQLRGEIVSAPAPMLESEIIGRRIKGADLLNLKKGIDQAIKKTEPGSPLQAELLNLKNDYMDWLDQQGTSFKEANLKFAEMSKPISQMKAGKILSEKLIPATSEETPTSLNAAALAKALQNKNEIAKKVTGLKGSTLEKVLTKDQLNTILNVNSDASRISEINKLGAGYGSPTARRLMATDFIGENFKKQAPITSKLLDALNKVPVIDYIKTGVGKVGGVLGKQINQEMAAELDRVLASDPQKLAKALKNELDLIKQKKIKLDTKQSPVSLAAPSYTSEAAKLGALLSQTQGEE